MCPMSHNPSTNTSSPSTTILDIPPIGNLLSVETELEIDSIIKSITDIDYNFLIFHPTIRDSVTIPMLSLLLASSPQLVNNQHIRSSPQGQEVINILPQTSNPILILRPHFVPNHTSTHTTKTLQ